MEVGDEGIDDAEAERGVDEEVGPSVPRLDRPVVAGDGLERPGRGRPDGDDPAAPLPRLADRGGRPLLDPEPLRLDPVVGEVRRSHRLEGARPDVESQAADPDAPGLDLREERFREMAPRGRRRDRARMPGVDGLVALEVEGPERIWTGGSGDVGGEGRPAPSVERRLEVRDPRELDPELPGSKWLPRFPAESPLLEVDLLPR